MKVLPVVDIKKQKSASTYCPKTEQSCDSPTTGATRVRKNIRNVENVTNGKSTIKPFYFAKRKDRPSSYHGNWMYQANDDFAIKCEKSFIFLDVEEAKKGKTEQEQKAEIITALQEKKNGGQPRVII